MPLVARWHATEQLIPPVQAALNLKNVQLELLRSYLAGPEYHWKAARTPSLIGGPWVNIEPAKSAAVERFLATLEAEQKNRLKFAADVEALDRLLRDSAKGNGLTSLYKKVPDSLRGYVELAYDASNQPLARYFEALLYRSPYYEPSLQSIALSLLDSDHRVAQFTTPVLEGDSAFCLQLAFSDGALDELFAMKTQSRSFAEICHRVGTRNDKQEWFRTFFTTETPAPYRRPSVSGVRIRYFGHACILFETDDVSVLIDPVVSYEYPGGPPRFTYRDLPDPIDFVVITHFHKDHLNFETLLQLRCRARNIIVPKNGGGAVQDPSFRSALQAIGFRNVIELDRLETLPLPGGEILALPFLGEHADLDIQSKSAYLVRLGGHAIMCAADSANIEPMLYLHLHHLIGDIDVLFMGMECVGAPLTTTYGGILLRPLPRAFDQERRTTGSDYEGALGIIDQLRPKQVYVYAMGLEPWLGHLLPIDSSRDALGVTESDRLIAECHRRGIVARRPYCAMELVLSHEHKGH
jgi:L-ascorbate metabolism protein UlaG (beta-lactamase superfamily)